MPKGGFLNLLAHGALVKNFKGPRLAIIETE